MPKYRRLGKQFYDLTREGRGQAHLKSQLKNRQEFSLPTHKRIATVKKRKSRTFRFRRHSKPAPLTPKVREAESIKTAKEIAIIAKHIKKFPCQDGLKSRLGLLAVRYVQLLNEGAKPQMEGLHALALALEAGIGQEKLKERVLVIMTYCGKTSACLGIAHGEHRSLLSYISWLAGRQLQVQETPDVKQANEELCREISQDPDIKAQMDAYLQQTGPRNNPS